MTTNNHDLNQFGDLSALEPEALLAAIPGEHPRAAAALALGRSAAETGNFDVAALTRIANELYAEGFPAGSPLANPLAASSVSAIPSTAAFAEAQPPNRNSGFGATPQAYFSPAVPDGIALATPASAFPGYSFAAPSIVDEANAVRLQRYPAAEQIQMDVLLGALEAPYAAELDQLLKGANIVSAATGFALAPASAPAPAQANVPAYYFLGGHPARAGVNPVGASAHPAFDADLVRKDFPILAELVNGRPLVWFDNAATTQKPQVVIDRLSYFYQHENSNIHRAAHELAARATDAYEEARETVRRFINAPSTDNIVFVRGTTEAINLVAQSWGRKHIGPGDEVLITHLEHHANIVPWQQLCTEKGAKLKVAPVDDSGQVIVAEYQKLITANTRLVSFTQVSNALGTVTPAQEMIDIAHRAGAKVLLDGAQSVSHMSTDVTGLGCDFFVFSGHKIFGPTGIGALYGTAEVLADMPPWQGGGNMIQDVTFDKIIYQPAPAKFEAGTGNIADAVGLGAALQYVEKLGIANIARYEHDLLAYATAALAKVPGLRLIGTAKEKASVLSFTLDGYKSEEVGSALNAEGIAVRSGHHCAQPILRRFGVETTVRASLAFYNTYAEVDLLLNTLLKLSSGKGF